MCSTNHLNSVKIICSLVHPITEPSALCLTRKTHLLPMAFLPFGNSTRLKKLCSWRASISVCIASRHRFASVPFRASYTVAVSVIPSLATVTHSPKRSGGRLSRDGRCTLASSFISSSFDSSSSSIITSSFDSSISTSLLTFPSGLSP